MATAAAAAARRASTVISVCFHLVLLSFVWTFVATAVGLELDSATDEVFLVHHQRSIVAHDQLQDDHYYDDQTFPKKGSTQCHYPCKCQKANDALGCKSGVSIIEDGCKCCKMCARQQGDLCDTKDKCDEDKGLFCDFILDDGIRGVCRVKFAKHCEVDGKTFKDGEIFQPNCSLKCTCQNGQYACASLCPQEERAPSRANCRDAQMVAIKGRCCREWVCPHSHSLPREEDDTAVSPAPTEKGACVKETTDWSACSATCGIGLSIRVTNENTDCRSKQERRICLVRPCLHEDKHLSGECKTTWREEKPKKLKYGESGECVSTDDYQLKYCSNCKKNKCCGPGRTKTIDVEFNCPEGKMITEKMMQIQKCECKALKKCNIR